MPVHKHKNPDGTFDVTVTCNDCGKPIVESNEHGMFCEDRCGYEESKAAKPFLDGLVENIMDAAAGMGLPQELFDDQNLNTNYTGPPKGGKSDD